MSKPGVLHTTAKSIYWWAVFNVNEEGFNFSRKFVDLFENPPKAVFTPGSAAFADFKKKNPTLIEGEIECPGVIRYASGNKSSLIVPYGHVILSKDDGTTAIYLSKCIPDSGSAIVASCQRTPPKLFEEIQRLRRENTMLRFKNDGKTRFYVPQIDSLENTREIANAFASFFGSFVVRYRPDVDTDDISHGAGFYKGEFIKNIDDVRYHTLSFYTQNKKEVALVHSAATMLGLTKDTFQKAITNVTRVVMGETEPKISTMQLLLEHVEFDTYTIINHQFCSEAEFSKFKFKSNQPLLRFIYECISDHEVPSLSLAMIDDFDEEQAMRMLKAMAAGTTNTFDTIEVMSRELCVGISTLCKKARLTYDVDIVEDRLWIFKIKKESDEVGNPSST